MQIQRREDRSLLGPSKLRVSLFNPLPRVPVTNAAAAQHFADWHSFLFAPPPTHTRTHTDVLSMLICLMFRVSYCFSICGLLFLFSEVRSWMSELLLKTEPLLIFPPVLVDLSPVAPGPGLWGWGALFCSTAFVLHNRMFSVARGLWAGTAVCVWGGWGGSLTVTELKSDRLKHVLKHEVSPKYSVQPAFIHLIVSLSINSRSVQKQPTVTHNKSRFIRVLICAYFMNDFIFRWTHFWFVRFRWFINQQLVFLHFSSGLFHEVGSESNVCFYWSLGVVSMVTSRGLITMRLGAAPSRITFHRRGT